MGDNKIWNWSVLDEVDLLIDTCIKAEKILTSVSIHDGLVIFLNSVLSDEPDCLDLLPIKSVRQNSHNGSSTCCRLWGPVPPYWRVVLSAVVQCLLFCHSWRLHHSCMYLCRVHTHTSFVDLQEYLKMKYCQFWNWSVLITCLILDTLIGYLIQFV